MTTLKKGLGILVLSIGLSISSTPSQSASVRAWTSEFKTKIADPMHELGYKQVTACMAKDAQRCVDGVINLGDGWQRALDWLDGNPTPACLQQVATDLRPAITMQRDGWKMAIASRLVASYNDENFHRGVAEAARGGMLFTSIRDKLYVAASFC